MAQKFTYKRKSISGCGHPGILPCCSNCDLMDMYITTQEAQTFAEKGASAAFKNERGEIIGSDADRWKTFCTRTGATVRPDHGCKHHVWAKDAWVKPEEETTLC